MFLVGQGRNESTSIRFFFSKGSHALAVRPQWDAIDSLAGPTRRPVNVSIGNEVADRSPFFFSFSVVCSSISVALQRILKRRRASVCCVEKKKPIRCVGQESRDE